MNVARIQHRVIVSTSGSVIGAGKAWDCCGANWLSLKVNCSTKASMMPPKMMDTERSKVRWVRSMLADRAAPLIKDW
ncbi:hypothetical protein E2C01_008045 [Portunus trituberculatus]|uniref:Uncharacterized protein n=1 Tax=Portunus trituberculatus TaxID=210409 RepID=A0A5B7D0R1_PORTR|nr:hypothetical protein [Portunus trituberculatus]